MNLNPQELGRRAEQMIRELAPISAEPDRLVRLFLSPEHRRAADVVARWMREAGMTVTEDALGTLRGRAGEGKRLLLGSHIDSVIDAGNYDGPLGVIVGILAVAHFQKLGWPLPFGIDVLAFADDMGDGKIAKGLADGAQTTITVPFDTAKALFVKRDQQAAMQAFMSGQIKVTGDMTKLMAAGNTPPSPEADAFGQKILELTAD